MAGAVPRAEFSPDSPRLSEGQMDIQQENQNFGLVPVQLFDAETPYARPDPCGAWLNPNRPERSDTVVFFCREEFEIWFKRGSPFKNALTVQKHGGVWVAYGQIREDALGDEDAKTFPYGVRIGDHEADPDVVVKKDPRR